jgi:choline dehydrogenase-like flavoprotein
VITEADFLAAAGVAPYDYIGVEVSAGGAPLAANLAVAGMRVLPLEAGIEEGQIAVGRVNSCGNGCLYRTSRSTAAARFWISRTRLDS